MTYGTAADGGLLSERRLVATAPTIPPPVEPTEEQIREALIQWSEIPLWWRSTNRAYWVGRFNEATIYPSGRITHRKALKITREYLSGTRQ